MARIATRSRGWGSLNIPRPMEAASYFWLGFGSAVGTLIVHKLWCKVAFGTGTVRGQPPADAPGRMGKLSWGETH